MVQIITQATCKQGVVEKADDIIHLTGGKGDSQGVVIIQANNSVYIPNDIKDRQQTIDNLVKLNQQTIALCDDLVKVINPIAQAMIKPIPGQTGLPTGLIAGFQGGINFQSKVSDIKQQLNQLTKDCNKLKDNLA